MNLENEYRRLAYYAYGMLHGLVHSLEAFERDHPYHDCRPSTISLNRAALDCASALENLRRDFDLAQVRRDLERAERAQLPF